MASLGAAIVKGFSKGVTGQRQQERDEEREQQRKLEQLRTAAVEGERAKSMFPSAEERIKTLGLAKAERSGRVPEPLGGFSPLERERGLPGEVEEAASQRRRTMLEQFGLIKPSTAFQSIFTVDPVTGEVKQIGAVPRGSKTVPAPKPLTPQQQAFVQGFSDLRSAIVKAEDLIAEDPMALLRTGVPFAPGAAVLKTTLTNAADILLRLRSGAQINEREYARLRGLLPTPLDVVTEKLGNPGFVAEKLERFRTTADALTRTKVVAQQAEEDQGSLIDRALDGDEAAIQQLRDAGIF